MNKRILACILIVILSLCLFACGNSREDDISYGDTTIDDSTDGDFSDESITDDTIGDDSMGEEGGDGSSTDTESEENTSTEDNNTENNSTDNNTDNNTDNSTGNSNTGNSSGNNNTGDNSTGNNNTENNNTGNNNTGNNTNGNTSNGNGTTGGNGSSSATTEEERLAEIYWNYLGSAYPYHTKEQHQQGCDAAVKLVQNIMKTYKTEIEREIALYEYICDICEYGGEPADGQSPYAVLVLNQAVCGGYAKTFQVCMNMMGIQCDYISGRSSTSSHAWNQVCIDGEWYEVDCTWADWKTGAVYDCFNLTSAEMDQREHAQYNVNRSRICYGGKYGKQYIVDKFTAEYKDTIKDIYFDTKAEVDAYITNQVNKGNYDITVYMTYDVKAEIGIYSSYIRSFRFEQFYDFEGELSAIFEKGMVIENVYQLTVKFTDMKEYEGMANYFDTSAECEAYLDSMAAKGVTSVTIYTFEDIYRDVVIWGPWEMTGAEGIGMMWTLYKYTLEYGG